MQISNNTFIKVGKKDHVLYGYSIAELVNGFWVCDIAPGAISAGNLGPSTGFMKIYNLVADVGAANKIRFDAPINAYSPISGKLEVWVR